MAYHGGDPLKKMRQIKNLDCLSDTACLQLYDEMKQRDWSWIDLSRFEPESHTNEIAYQKVRWLVNRAKALKENA